MDKLKNFIEKSKKRHGDKYKYEKVIYKNSKEKVEIICNDHGSFFVRPDAHVRKVGCPKCSGGVKYDNDIFIEKCKELRGDDFYYDRILYKKSTTKVLIGCKKHGYFSIRPSNFLSGQGCSKCGGVYRKKTSDFINECVKVNGDVYDYSEVVYVNNKTKVKIICKKHGLFTQSPKDHLNGHGCGLCNMSRGENKISKMLDILGIKFEKDKNFRECRGIKGGCLPFDFFIKEKNTLIEYDGRQHHEPVDRFGGVDVYNNQVRNDVIRNNWCLSNNINLIRISYKDDDDKIIECLSKLYNHDFKRYLNSYNELFDYLKNISSDIVFNYRNNNLNCDFLLRDKNIAIRVLGFLKNNDKNQDKKINIDLKKEFDKHRINLINIFEDQWIEKKEIIKSRLEYLTNNNLRKIMARKCEVRIVSENKEVREFLINNHIQGFTGSKFKIGLYYKDELVSLMTFGSLRKNMGSISKEESYELLRFCNLKGCVVIGSASKLFSFFLKKFKPINIVSYADLSWSKMSENLYEKVGFIMTHISKPSYYYIKDGVRRNRFLYRKDVLVSMGHDKDKTEFEICDSLGYLRIYDTGTIKYTWSI